MVTGVDRFRAHFAGHEHQYVLIGGAACELIMDEVGLDFRATKDLDIVLIVEALDAAFAERFWAFVEQGGYEIRERSQGEKILYRFQRPKAEDFPAMLELFSRSPEGLTLAEDSHLTPLPIDEAAASLSAILLDEDYYAFLKSMVRDAGGIPVLNEAAIIPFKARAWLDLSRERDAGGKVDEKNIKKHRNDVARLLQVLSPEASYPLPETVAKDMRAFVEVAIAEVDYNPKQFKVNMTREDVADRLRAAYQL
ncbi:hypothetical protein ACG873_02340 [Mesorhizobium sp. AaZ16]|uniref:hypothetical protein n=1 Tax=Mesorhizobium sp. AaZ16 TaxID=3402289 RepID=UPI00374E5BA9